MNWEQGVNESEEHFYMRIARDEMFEFDAQHQLMSGHIEQAVKRALPGQPVKVIINYYAPRGGGATVNVRLPDTRPWWRKLFGLESKLQR